MTARPFHRLRRPGPSTARPGMGGGDRDLGDHAAAGSAGEPGVQGADLVTQVGVRLAM